MMMLMSVVSVLHMMITFVATAASSRARGVEEFSFFFLFLRGGERGRVRASWTKQAGERRLDRQNLLHHSKQAWISHAHAFDNESTKLPRNCLVTDEPYVVSDWSPWIFGDRILPLFGITNTSCALAGHPLSSMQG